MRRLFLLSILLAVTAAYARQISPQEAASVASEFMNAKAPATRAAVSPLRVTDGADEKGAQPYYVFNSTAGDGFVIVSGDDRFSKILGYSDRGSFDFKNMPPQLKALLEQFAKNTGKSSGWNSTHPSWNSSTFSTRANGEVLLETAEWGQDAPFNAETPMFGDQHAPTGCVATAMAIVMKYHNWPETYNWDAMPMKIEQDGENPPAANPELARLMKDAGEAVYMGYGSLESGANMNWVGHRMQQVFRYSPDCQYITKQNFSTEDWLGLLKNNVDNGNPVIYQGTDKDLTMNHAFIVDGYNSKGYHINWGWDGWFNGYYALDALTPNDSQDFSCNNGMVINIVPDKNNKTYSECFTDFGYFWVAAGIGTAMNLSVENVKTGEPFHLINTLITLPKGFEGLVGLALVDKDGNIKEIISSENQSTYSSTDGEYLDMGVAANFIDVKVSVDVDPTDRLQLVTKNTQDDKYKLVLGTLEWPSSVAVVNNAPQYGKVDLEIGKDIKFVYDFGFGERYIEAPAGKSEVKALSGLTMYFTCEPTNAEKDHLVTVALRGKKVIGLGNFAGDRINYSIDVSDDSKVKAQIPNLQAEEITLSKAGTLKDLINADDAINVNSLTLTGVMNALDFWYIRDNMPALNSLNIKNVEIEEVEACDGSISITPVLNQANVIPEGALVSLSLVEEVVFPDNLAGIADNSMMDMNLKKITIPSGVKFIGLNAFYSNRNLEAVEILNPEPFAINDCVFHVTPVRENGILFVPEGSSDLYKEVADWSNFNRIVEGKMPENVMGDVTVDNIKYHYLYDKARVNGYEGEPISVIIPENIKVGDQEIPVTRIHEFSLGDCNSITSVVIPDCVTEIGERSFSGCQNLKTVKLSKNLKTIGREAFYNSFSLEECDIPSSVEELGFNAFLNTALKRVTIPKNARPQNELSVFGGMSGLDKFVVEEGNPYFKEIDGVLYRVFENDLVLECVPGLKQGTLILPDNCVTAWSNSITYVSEIKEIIFNSNLETIEREAVRAENLEHITLPKNAFVYSYAINGTDLKSVTFTGELKNSSEMFAWCSSLENIFVESPDETVNLDGIFNEPKESINIFSSSPVKNFVYSDECVIYVPGKAADNYVATRAADIREMWRYNVNRKDKTMEIVPQFDGVEIDKVTVNGKETNPTDGIYTLSDPNNIDVKVEYTLLGRQKMTTHYTSEFNEKVPDAVVTGVGEIMGGEPALIDVYGLDGILYKKGCSKEDLNDLKQGVYIIRQGSKSRKIVVTK